MSVVGHVRRARGSRIELREADTSKSQERGNAPPEMLKKAVRRIQARRFLEGGEPLKTNYSRSHVGRVGRTHETSRVPFLPPCNRIVPNVQIGVHPVAVFWSTHDARASLIAATEPLETLRGSAKLFCRPSAAKKRPMKDGYWPPESLNWCAQGTRSFPSSNFREPLMDFRGRGNCPGFRSSRPFPVALEYMR